MDISPSHCSSSDSESGWTMYLDHSSLSKNRQTVNANYTENEEEEESLSMVSDASSGPPIYDQRSPDFKNSKKKKKEFGRNQHQYDDTASSHLKVGITNEASMEFSQGFSATHFKKGKSSLKNNFGFVKSSQAEKPDSKEAGGRKWK